jgi:ankyrin repeat protein
VRGGRLDVARVLLASRSVDPNAECDGEIPIEAAIRLGSPPLVSLLLGRRDIDVSAKGRVLGVAAQGSPEVVSILLASGKIDANAKNESRETLLHLSADAGNIEVVKLLCGMEAISTDAKDNVDCLLSEFVAKSKCFSWEYRTPIQRAMAANHPDVAKVILRASRRRGRIPWAKVP